MIQPTLVARALEERQVLSTSLAFPMPTTPMSSQASMTGSVFQPPTGLFSLTTGLPTPTTGAQFGNSKGGISDQKNGGISKGGIAAIVVVLVLLLISIGAFFLLYRRGYFVNVQRRARAIRLRRTGAGTVDRSQISYPVDDKINLTRFASEPGTAPPAPKNQTAFTVQRTNSVDSLRSGPQWNTDDRRLSAPLPPTPSAGERIRESGALGAMDWRTMNPVSPVGAAPRKDDPFADPENGIGVGRTANRAMTELDDVLAMEKNGRR